MKSSDTNVGEWVNVIGYISLPPLESLDAFQEGIARRPESEKGKQANGQKQRRMLQEHCKVVHVQAVLLWPAGAIRLSDYEKIVRERKEMEKRLMSI